MMRQPIVCVLGHVDHGKTSLLDAIRSTSVQEREAGFITQHIGASEVPLKVIKEISAPAMQSFKINLSLPGLLFIDTPGHEVFTNLRRRGGSIADIAILVIDVMQGVQNQTVEAIEILKEYKTPFVVALTKVDALPGWKKCEGESFSNSLKQQRQDVQLLLDEKLYQIVGEVYKHGFSSERFDRVSDFTKQVCAIPVSAVSGEGLPELLLFLSGLAQKFLEGELDSGENKSGKASILEVKEEKGLGMTLDCVLYYGSLKRGDSIAFSTINGVAESKVKALLEPKPLQEMRDPKQKFSSVEEAFSARGVKVSCEFAGDAVAGSSLLAWRSEGEKESSVSLLESEMKEIVFAKDAKGAIVCADALGSLEAIERLFSAEGIPVSKAAIGKVQKKEILEAKAIAETSKELGVVFAFNTKMEDGVEEEAKKLGVKIFSENVIYYLIDNYKKWVFEERNRERSEAFSRICLAKITALPNCCFRLSNPCIIGVEVLEGTLKKECDLMNAQGDKLGTVRAIQREKKEVEEAKRGEQVAISIEGSVCFGRQLKEKETLYSMITKEDYNLLKKRYMQALGEGERELLEEIAALRGLRISL